MRINEAQFADLKVRFEKYFQTVPQQLWFTGRKDAPSPTRQTHAVQQMFGIDLTAVGGDPVPEVDDHIQSRRHQELKVAISRLEQWEGQQKITEKRKNGVSGLTLEDLGLSVRTLICLRNAGLTHVSQLSGVSEMDLLRTKNFGRKSVNELKEVLAQVGVQLKGSAESALLNGTQQGDLETVVAGIKKLPEEDAREVSLCLLNLMLPFAVNNQVGTDLVRHLREQLLGE
ncbi:MAG: DNA-directed RNA polymerase subunit alpha C-terminal domain-containing protein [Candidatus Paceibacterota bacterium]